MNQRTRGQVPKDLQYMVPSVNNKTPRYETEYQRHGIEPVAMRGRGGVNPIPKRASQEPKTAQIESQEQSHRVQARQESYIVDGALNYEDEEEVSYPEQTSIPSVGSDDVYWNRAFEPPGQKEDLYVVVYGGENYTFNKSDLDNVLIELIFVKKVPKEAINIYKKIEYSIGVKLSE
jgi:hypothetical protein